MSKRKKKNAVTLISLLLVTVALIVFYIWYSGRNQASEEDKSNTPGTVSNTQKAEDNLEKVIATLFGEGVNYS
jgi:flagellar basal body-associated protein FliL